MPPFARVVQSETRWLRAGFWPVLFRGHGWRIRRLGSRGRLRGAEQRESLLGLDRSAFLQKDRRMAAEELAHPLAVAIWRRVSPRRKAAGALHPAGNPEHAPPPVPHGEVNHRANRTRARFAQTPGLRQASPSDARHRCSKSKLARAQRPNRFLASKLAPPQRQNRFSESKLALRSRRARAFSSNVARSGVQRALDRGWLAPEKRILGFWRAS